MSDNKCGPCSGSGKRHSIFDFCNCNQKCEDLGVCGACDGSGAMSDNKTEKRWTVEVTEDGDVLYRGQVLWGGYSNDYTLVDSQTGEATEHWGLLPEMLAFIDEQEDGKR